MRLVFSRTGSAALWKSACAATLLALAACGGGGGSGGGGTGPVTPPGPVDPPVDPLLEAARTARVTASFNTTSHQLTLRWTDNFTTESGFRIERQEGSDWQLISIAQAPSGSGSTIEWLIPYSDGLRVRVAAMVNGNKYVLKTASAADILIGEPPAPLPAIVLPGEEAKGSVPLSINNAPAGATVRYLIDGQPVGGTLQASPFRLDWNTASYRDGLHGVEAMLQVSQDQTWLISKSVRVNNGVVEPGQGSYIYTRYDSRTEITRVGVVAPSPVGIASVQFFVDGQAQPPMLLPNGCVYVVSCAPDSSSRASPPWSYDLVMKHADWPNGNHAIRALIIDNAGARYEVSDTIPTNAPPVITLTSLLNNQILVDPNLRLQGQVSDDLGTADVIVSMNGKEVLRGGTGPIDLTLPLARNAGTNVFIEARDSQAKRSLANFNFYYQPDSAFRPQALGLARLLWGSDGDTALAGWFDPAEQSYVLKRFKGSAQSGPQTVPLEGINQLQFSDFAASDGWFAANTYYGYPLPTDRAIRAWGPDGKRRNLTQETGTDMPLGIAVGSGGWFAWVAGASADPDVMRLTLLQMSTGKTFSVKTPVSGQYLNSGDMALAADGNNVKLVFSVLAGGVPKGVYLFDSATGATQALSPAGAQDRDVQTDGKRIVWRRYPAGPIGIDAPYSLVSAPLSNPTASTILSTAAKDEKLADGLLGWNERGLTSNAVKVNDGRETVVLSNRLDAGLAAVGGGAVALYSGSQLQLWTPALGPRTVFDVSQEPNGIPINGRVQLTRGSLYFLISGNRGDDFGTLHRVPF